MTARAAAPDRHHHPSLPTATAAANRIVVSDTGRKDVGIDDLIVEPVPEPMTAMLMLVGAGAVYLRRRGR